ncbi:MAG: class I SAM-dependent methyltransferase [Desulfuromonadaceae bacterium]|nr:class I SAM-dependent methyltransferase [Geobacteraceae bacterium]
MDAHTYTTDISDIIGWSHFLCAEVLSPGDMAVDLTLGNGNDCLHLACCVEARTTGGVLGFDIQHTALERSARLLATHGFPTCIHTDSTRDCFAARTEPYPDATTGVHLFHSGHQDLQRHLQRAPKVVLGNLGYLPGGDHSISTAAFTTLSAIKQGLAALMPKGRLIMVVYPGHANGQREAKELSEFFTTLAKQEWDVINIGCPNATRAPFLLSAERRH